MDNSGVRCLHQRSHHIWIWKKIKKLQVLIILFSPKANVNIIEVFKVFVCKFQAKYQAHAAHFKSAVF